MNVSLKKLTDALVRLQSQINALSQGGSGVQSIVAGANVTVDSTDPQNPIVSATSGGGTTAARAWRVYVTSINGSTSACEIRKLRMHASSGGSDLCTGGTAFASSSFSGYPPSAAFGADPGGLDAGHSWASATAVMPASLAYKLPTATVVNEITIEAPHNESTTQCPKNLIVQSSTDSTDGVNGIWRNEWSVVDQTGWVASEVRTFTRP